jgi:hypothetical protein
MHTPAAVVVNPVCEAASAQPMHAPAVELSVEEVVCPGSSRYPQSLLKTSPFV